MACLHLVPVEPLRRSLFCASDIFEHMEKVLVHRQDVEDRGADLGEAEDGQVSTSADIPFQVQNVALDIELLGRSRRLDTIVGTDDIAVEERARSRCQHREYLDDYALRSYNIDLVLVSREWGSLAGPGVTESLLVLIIVSSGVGTLPAFHAVGGEDFSSRLRTQILSAGWRSGANFAGGLGIAWPCVYNFASGNLEAKTRLVFAGHVRSHPWERSSSFQRDEKQDSKRK
ncbi:hypothetical protein M409DRAFT_57297 [Zasmidium cellare ATCC 36951]|uniref:Uncharacterized protein n=1 Tax=Zasmidium cellare ATCC 36951 TaxID=1080233 RepID=A0A6A6C9U8_ZASCE|nr:uncharacterized protein M409DRAFT_57297 [Zasmidium cellare ATCC 36951]KAF2163821.1 hypothetical protein M409DRAFT_57297 [Zasmidium cellare ATCC 36951]